MVRRSRMPFLTTMITIFINEKPLEEALSAKAHHRITVPGRVSVPPVSARG